MCIGYLASLEPSIYKIMVYSAGKVSIEQRTNLSSIYIIPWVSNIPYFINLYNIILLAHYTAMLNCNVNVNIAILCCTFWNGCSEIIARSVVILPMC